LKTKLEAAMRKCRNEEREWPAPDNCQWHLASVV